MSASTVRAVILWASFAIAFVFAFFAGFSLWWIFLILWIVYTLYTCFVS